MISLKERFEQFMLSTPGVESIDELARPRESQLIHPVHEVAALRRKVKAFRQ